MIQKMFAVYDLKAKAFMQPWYSPNAGSAARAFADAVNDEKTPFFKHPEDYQLFELGTFDDLSGLCSAQVPMTLLGLASDFKEGFGRGMDPKYFNSVLPAKQPVEAGNGSKKA